jgi:disulfide bond formation protein DsbB
MLSPEKEAIFMFLNNSLSLATFIGVIVLGFWVLDFILLHTRVLAKYRKYYKHVSRFALPAGFFLTFISTFFSLIYSDYLGVLPCGLCWFQRIFIYGMMFLFGMAWYKNDRKIFDYILLFSGVGLIIALYQHYLQMGYSELIPCPAIASTVDCAEPTFIEYGFITFPFMAVVMFGYTIMLSLTAKFFDKENI